MLVGMKRVAGIAALAMLSLASAGVLAQPGSLDAEIQRVISTQKFGQAKIGVSVRDVQSGVELADIHASEPFTPASNMKLLTSGSALLVLSPEFSFRTELLLDNDRLIIKGAGDPALADPVILQAMQPRLTVDDVLGLFSTAAVKTGVKSFREIVVDDRVFDRQSVHPDWPVDQLNRGYCAEVSGVNFHANVLMVYPRPNPDGPGTAPLYALEPEAPWLHIQNRARTVGSGKNSVWLARDSQSDDIIMRGDVRTPAAAGVEVTIREPAAFTGRLLASSLSRAGLGTDGGATPTVRLAAPSEAFPNAKPIAAIVTPMSEVMRRCNTDSENLYAECLLKRTANAVTKEAGSWTNGAAVLRMVLSQKMSPEDAARTTIADGSGMSRNDAVPPATLTRWLKVLADTPTTHDAFAASLATVGEGTLKSRYQNAKFRNEVRGKSGYINGVRCLSGYLIDPQSGKRVAFSVMINDLKGEDTQSAFTLNEEVLKACDRWLSRETESDRPKIGG